jgi:hypothetical protein
MRCPYPRCGVRKNSSDRLSGAVAGGYHPTNRRGGHRSEKRILITERVQQILLSYNASSFKEPKHSCGNGFSDILDIFVCRRGGLKEKRLLGIV